MQKNSFTLSDADDDFDQQFSEDKASINSDENEMSGVHSGNVKHQETVNRDRQKPELNRPSSLISDFALNSGQNWNEVNQNPAQHFQGTKEGFWGEDDVNDQVDKPEQDQADSARPMLV